MLESNINDGIHAQRDVIMGNVVYNLADLSQVEALLEQIVTLLGQPETRLEVGKRDPMGREDIVLYPPEGESVSLPPQFVGQLGQLQHTTDTTRREQIYLARFILDQTYARWERLYVPLAGTFNLQPSLRLSDRADQGLSAAGIQLPDIRQALTEYEKTRLVILGDPGAGKTTTLERLAIALARERLRDPINGKLPLWVDLYTFQETLDPTEFLSAKWESTGLPQPYGEAIARGQVCFLLDGLNQMPLADMAQRIERWAHWANRELPPGNWAVFTCRSADYIASLRLPEVRVQNLDKARMRRYFERRFGQEKAANLWQEFDRRLHSGDHRFERLARNPFMLSLLADHCAAGKGLTSSRARLMENLAYHRLEHELSYGRQPLSLTRDPRGTLAAVLEALSRMAFAMQQARGEGTILSRAEAERLSLGDQGALQLSLDEIVNIALDAHLLSEETIAHKGKVQTGYTFYHHLLQEYFAARRLLALFRRGQRLRPYARPPRGWRRVFPHKLRAGEQLPPLPVTGWEETLMMAASLAGKDLPAFIRAVQRHNLPLAGRCLAEADPHEDASLRPLVADMQTALLTHQRNTKAPLQERIAAGLALGELGHPDLRPQPFTFEGKTVWAIVPPLETVPAGEFLLGSDPDDPEAYNDERTTQRRQHLPAFAIGRYPVTNAEFRLFIEAGGYHDDRWWSAAGKAWKRGGPDAHAAAIENWLRTREWLQGQNLAELRAARGYPPQWQHYWERMVKLSPEEARAQARRQFERPFDRPAFWDDPALSSPARPVVGVNWYEAEAYCRWLSAVSGQKFALPTERMWEKAARGSKGRIYPWGNAFDVRRCNTVESHIYETTPVGLYPAGVSPYGLFDAAGNVWEWTASWYRAYPGSRVQSADFGEKFRVVRGGSWYNIRRGARCAFRGRDVPVFFSDGLGFRVVSPGS